MTPLLVLHRQNQAPCRTLPLSAPQWDDQTPPQPTPQPPSAKIFVANPTLEPVRPWLIKKQNAEKCATAECWRRTTNTASNTASNLHHAVLPRLIWWQDRHHSMDVTLSSTTSQGCWFWEPASDRLMAGGDVQCLQKLLRSSRKFPRYPVGQRW